MGWGSTPSIFWPVWRHILGGPMRVSSHPNGGAGSARAPLFCYTFGLVALVSHLCPRYHTVITPLPPVSVWYHTSAPGITLLHLCPRYQCVGCPHYVLTLRVVSAWSCSCARLEMAAHARPVVSSKLPPLIPTRACLFVSKNYHERNSCRLT